MLIYSRPERDAPPFADIRPFSLPRIGKASDKAGEVGAQFLRTPAFVMDHMDFLSEPALPEGRIIGHAEEGFVPINTWTFRGDGSDIMMHAVDLFPSRPGCPFGASYIRRSDGMKERIKCPNCGRIHD